MAFLKLNRAIWTIGIVDVSGNVCIPMVYYSGATYTIDMLVRNLFGCNTKYKLQLKANPHVLLLTEMKSDSKTIIFGFDKKFEQGSKFAKT